MVRKKTDEEPPVPEEDSSEESEDLQDWTGDPEQPDVENEKSITDVAKQVLAGEWGRGQERRLALSDAGYDPNAVQTEVVRLLNE